ncbi:NifB/NifX family molybdenum-iron cluster-binding protein [Pseudomonas lopnurensis]|uniref:NifB/NifX family molybdenum-iron cluster-binding protein n=1 Tax=Pseudomonas lopnurensis TaxID=1477517 RepID=UPI00187AD14F|nr:NifB/NifX family molybdenum-iron cluster-binding protein [Pseudomonas lopnurensis]MBE7374222.1 dinitrogenase iron-molybdenum cofactor biosynthesis protein [Pseudomonas lopnurensis]
MLDFPVKLAVASQEGLAISEHFGHARRFWIYAVDPDACRLLETREVEHYCLGNHSSKTAMAGILEAIRDCQAVFVARIGDGPVARLKAIGVQPVAGYAWEPIDASLLDYVRRTLAGEQVS